MRVMWTVSLVPQTMVQADMSVDVDYQAYIKL